MTASSDSTPIIYTHKIKLTAENCHEVDEWRQQYGMPFSLYGGGWCLIDFSQFSDSLIKKLCGDWEYEKINE